MRALFPHLVFALSRLKVASAIRQLENGKSSGTFEKWEDLALQIIRFHQKKNDFYSHKCKGVSDGLLQLPILQKKDFQQPLEEMLTQGVNLKDCYVASTSGSSGHPFFFAKDLYCHALTWANIIMQYKGLGVSVFDKQARFYGIPTSGWSRWKEQAKDFFFNRIRLDVFDLDEHAMSSWLFEFKKNKFVFVNGYTSVIVLFARYCLANNITLNQVCPTLKICIVTSETCTPEDKKLISDAFGIPVVNEYGASEIDLIAMEGLDGLWRVCESNVFVEVVDDDGHPLPDGQEGRLLVTALHNKAMPFIRYEIGDRGILGLSDKGERLILGLTGRTNDMVLLPSGKKAAGLTFYYISRSLLEKGGFLQEFIIRQIALDTFVFEIVATRDLTAFELHAIQHEMDAYLEPGLKIIIRRLSRIERKGSGKLKHFYSEIDT